MSLQLLAKQMEAKGRGGDSLLVHMTPDEVAGLQKLAESAGGSLTVNPETGLVEANFLKRMLPTIVGIGVGIGTGNPFLGAAAGAAVGGYQAKENDQDVLLGAGLGALGGYGGAGLGAGLTAAGGTAAATGAATAGAGAGTAAGTAATGAAGAGTAGTAASMTGDAAIAEAVQRQAAEQALAEQATQETIAQNAAAESQRQATREIMTGYNPNAVAPEMSYAAQPPSMATEYGLNTGTAQTSPLTVGESFNQAGRGIGQMGTEAGRAEFAKEFGYQKAAAAAAPAMAPGKLEKEEGVPVDDEMYYTEYTPGQTGERSSTSTEARQFAESRFAPMEKIKAADYMDRVRRRNIYAAKGGLMSFAEGGVAGNSGLTAEAMDYLMSDSGASQAGLQYLMGQADRSSPMQARAQVQRNDFVVPTRGESVTSTLDGYREIATGPYQGLYEKTDGKLTYDPTAQKFYRSDDVFKYVPPPPEPAYDPYAYSGGNAAGGLIGLAKGGMASGGFVIPADVVSMVGEGNTDAGYKRIKSMVPGATAIKGKDGGQADTVKTHIDGKQPARVAHGEMYVPPETVKRMGGAKKLYAMMDKVRAQATGSKKQIKPVSLKRALA